MINNYSTQTLDFLVGGHHLLSTSILNHHPLVLYIERFIINQQDSLFYSIDYVQDMDNAYVNNHLIISSNAFRIDDDFGDGGGLVIRSNFLPLPVGPEDLEKFLLLEAFAQLANRSSPDDAFKACMSTVNIKNFEPHPVKEQDR